jgi:hypothetical protein
METGRQQRGFDLLSGDRIATVSLWGVGHCSCACKSAIQNAGKFG